MSSEREISESSEAECVLSQVSKRERNIGGNTSNDIRDGENDSDSDYFATRKRIRKNSDSSVDSLDTMETDGSVNREICPNGICRDFNSCGCSGINSDHLSFDREHGRYTVFEKHFDDACRRIIPKLRKKIIHEIVEIREPINCSYIYALISQLSKRDYIHIFYHGFTKPECIGGDGEGAICKYLRVHGRFTSDGPSEETNLVETGSRNFRECPTHLAVYTETCDDCRRFQLERRRRSTDSSEEDEERNWYECGYTKPHLHVLHDCQWNGYSCRCHNVLSVKRSVSRDVHADHGSTFEHIKNVFIYGAKEGRYNSYTKVGSHYQLPGGRDYFGQETKKVVLQSTVLGHRYLHAMQLERRLEKECSLREGIHRPEQQSSKVTAPIKDGFGGGTSKRGSGSKHLCTTIEGFLNNNPCFPITAIKYTDAWINSNLKTLSSKCSAFETALENYKTLLTKWNIQKFTEYYINRHCIFAAVNEDFDEHYFSVSESVDHIHKFLKFQLNIEKDEDDFLPRLKDFWETVYNICDKKLKKKNTIYIISVPSAGKNWFWNMILEFYLNTGIIENFTRAHAFPFNDAVNRRINLWNEINFMPSALDTVKMIAAGDTFATNIKHKPNAALFKTPLIAMSNPPNVFRDAAFKDRVAIYHWKKAPFLKKVHKYPHPLTYPYFIWKLGLCEFNDVCINHFVHIEQEMLNNGQSLFLSEYEM